MQFFKYTALGNDYLVLEPAAAGGVPAPSQIRTLCDRRHGLGSDGLLLGPLEAPDCDFGLRLFNPDGSEFEKSGNGLRIFARYLWDRRLVGGDPFSIIEMVPRHFLVVLFTTLNEKEMEIRVKKFEEVMEKYNLTVVDVASMGLGDTLTNDIMKRNLGIRATR